MPTRSNPIPAPIPAPTPAPKKATKQLSMDNYFGVKSPIRAPIIVPEIVKPGRGKGKPVAHAKSPAPLSRKAPVKKERDMKTPASAKSTRGYRSRVKGSEDSEGSDFVASDGEDPESEVAEGIPTDEEDDIVEDEIEDTPTRRKKTAKSGKPTAGGKVKHVPVPKDCGLKIEPRDGDLPPISDLQLMFDDIVSRLPDLTSLFKGIGVRKLRVATMCSGTESPLLALGLMGRSMKEQGIGKLEVEHVFSCEIEPYKQAYDFLTVVKPLG